MTFTLAACDNGTTDHEHAWGAWAVKTAATEEAAGVEERACKLDSSHKETRPIAKLEHQWGEWTVKIAATEETEGEEERVCTLNGLHKETRPIAKLDKWGDWAVKTAATEEADGEEERVCTTHEGLHKETRPIAKLEHQWGEWTVTTPASILADGKEQRVCSLNGSHTEERVITKLISLIETVEVQNGTFLYGRDGTSGGTLVEVKEDFHIGKYQVTQAQWKAVMDNNRSGFQINPATGEVQENRPVERVSWYDVLVYANKLSVKEGLQPVYKIKGSTDPGTWGNVPTSSNTDWNAVEEVPGANGWRLPTEQQWEFAAKGGRNTAKGYTGTSADTYYVYSGSDTVGDVAWYTSNATNKTHEVGKKKANELGLYDMSGNVDEWCFDKWSSTSAGRVVRGGSWGNSAADVRSAYRDINSPFVRYDFIGFRLVRS
ncbi:MAG: formylglycine-generating enzyme family protein [Treponema sp.]|nr:formylglycine-generating enzyme family protein [Treponema sp.]